MFPRLCPLWWIRRVDGRCRLQLLLCWEWKFLGKLVVITFCSCTCLVCIIVYLFLMTIHMSRLNHCLFSQGETFVVKWRFLFGVVFFDWWPFYYFFLEELFENFPSLPMSLFLLNIRLIFWGKHIYDCSKSIAMLLVSHAWFLFRSEK